jgi:hypothetical protein
LCEGFGERILSQDTTALTFAPTISNHHVGPTTRQTDTGLDLPIAQKCCRSSDVVLASACQQCSSIQVGRLNEYRFS